MKLESLGAVIRLSDLIEETEKMISTLGDKSIGYLTFYDFGEKKEEFRVDKEFISIAINFFNAKLAGYYKELSDLGVDVGIEIGDKTFYMEDNDDHAV